MIVSPAGGTDDLMGRALRQLCTVLLCALAFGTPRGALAKRRWRLMHSPKADDVVVMPGNLSLGAGTSLDVTRAHWGPSVTAELFTGTWRRLAWTGAEMRLLLYSPCPRCGAAGDHFVGSRFGVVLAADRKRRHILTMGAAAGWGTVAVNWGGRDRYAHGLMVSPNIRYTAFGFVGLEAAALLPAYRPGGRYPAAITFSVVGSLLVLAALTKA